MKCQNCGSDLDRRIGDIEVPDSRVGMLAIYKAEYWDCPDCGAKLYTPTTVAKVDHERRNKTEELIKEWPIGDFITLTEAARIIGISKQAVHKNRKIYGIKLGGKPVYLRKSVIRYKERRDGRFALVPGKRFTEALLDVSYKEKEVPAEVSIGQKYIDQPVTTESSGEVAYA